MNTYTVSGVSFEYSFSSNVELATENQTQSTWKRCPNDACYWILKDELHVQSPEIKFHGMVKASASDYRFVEQWSIGLIQNIYGLDWVGHYENNLTRHIRQNPKYLPIRDGNEQTPPWYDTSDTLKNGVLTMISGSDPPMYVMPLTIVEGTGFQSKRRKLLATSGIDRFSTHLAAVRETDKSIVVLSRIDWETRWNGQVIMTTQQQARGLAVRSQDYVWKPDDEVLRRNVAKDVQKCVFNGKINGSQFKTKLNLSPDQAVGFENFQLDDNGRWVNIDDESLKPDAFVNPSPIKWTNM